MSDDPDLDPTYYPRRAARLIGHRAAESALLTAAQADRLAHGWLIAGPEGIGKATLAFRFARFLLAGGQATSNDMFGGGPVDLAVDAAAPVFQRVVSGGHADLLTVTRTTNEKTGKMRGEIVMDDVGRIAPFFGKTAAEGGYRVCIVDCADDLNRNSANALLKILEEPPKHSVLLLVCHSPGRLIPTIRSRCRTLMLRPLSDVECEVVIRDQAPDLAADDLAALARLAEGAPGRALRLQAAGGLELYKTMIELIETLPRPNWVKVQSLGDRLSRKNDGGWAVFGDLLTWWLARLVRAGATRTQPAEIVAGEGPLISRLLAAGSLEPWVELWENVGHLIARADSAALSKKQVVLNVFAALERTASRV